MNKNIKLLILIFSVFTLTLSSVYAATIKWSLQNKAWNFVSYICYETPMTWGYFTCIMKNLVHNDSFWVINNTWAIQNLNNNSNTSIWTWPFYWWNLVINAKCWSAAGQTFSNIPYYNLCELGTPTQIMINWWYKWSCIWNKWETVSCSAWMSNGVWSNSDWVCWEANWKTYDIPPSTDKLCSSWNPEWLVWIWPWTWLCAWPKSARCLAYKSTSQPICENKTKDNIWNSITIHKADWSRQGKWTDGIWDEKSCDYASFESHFYRSGAWCIATVNPWETHAYEFTNWLYPSINISSWANNWVEVSISECPWDFDNVICKPRSWISLSITSSIYNDCWKIELWKRYYYNIRKPINNWWVDWVQVVAYNTSWEITSYSFKPKEQKLDPSDANWNKFSQTYSWTWTLNKDWLYIFPFKLNSYSEKLSINSWNNNSKKYVTYSISENPWDFENTIKAWYREDLWSWFRTSMKFWSEAWVAQTSTYWQIKAEIWKQYYLNIKIQYEWANPNFDNTGNIAISLK